MAENLLISLQIMLQGMVGIFVAIILIMLVILLLQKVFKDDDTAETKEN